MQSDEATVLVPEAVVQIEDGFPQVLLAPALHQVQPPPVWRYIDHLAEAGEAAVHWARMVRAALDPSLCAVSSLPAWCSSHEAGTVAVVGMAALVVVGHGGAATREL